MTKGNTGNGSIRMRYLITSMTILVMVGAVGAFFWLRKGPQAEGPRPVAAVAVTALKIVPRDVPISFEFIGKTRSVSRVEIRARVDGFLEKRLYEEGAMVEKGQLLFQMDQKPFAAKLASSKADQQAQEAALNYAKINLDRTQTMVGNNVTARKDLDVATSNYKSAVAAVEMAKAQVQQDELDLGYTTIFSPIRGLTSYAQQEVGAYINNTDKSLLTYVAQLDPMRVEFSVSENLILRLRDYVRKGLIREESAKTPVEIQMVDGRVYPYKGEITFADASFSETTGSFLVRASIPNPKEELRPGQFVRIRILGSVRPQAVVIPQRCVLQNAKGNFVWLIKSDGKVHLQPVVPSEWHEQTFWFISEGLKAGDVIAVDGAGKLSDGVTAKIEEYVEAEIKSEGANAANPPAGKTEEQKGEQSKREALTNL
jgi:membrane fusion protein, multidrug efflux system